MRLVIWLVQCAWGCHHSRLSNVFTIKKRTYQVCLECGREFPYSWELMRSVRSNIASTYAPLYSAGQREISVI
jgi:hypothetical protein